MKMEYLKNRFIRFIRHFTMKFEKTEYDTPRMEYRVGESGRNTIEVVLFGYRLVLGLPNWVNPHYIQHKNPHLEGSPAWQNYYAWTEKFPKVFGWYLYDGHHFVLQYGARTHSSSDTKQWSTFLPWTQQRLFEKVLIDANTEQPYYISMANKKGHVDFNDWYKQKEAMPKRLYQLLDYDGAEITAEVFASEMTYLRGTGSFHWVSWFTKPIVYRHIDISFSAEVGRQKGSWKGGILGTSYPIPMGQTADQAMRLYVASRAGNGNHRDDFGLKFQST